MKDKCVICGRETPYNVDTHVDMREGYVEGQGQTCPGGCKGKKEEKKGGVFTPGYIMRSMGEIISMN
jgi:hypothetical protein